MNELNLPKQDDVEQFEMGDKTVSVVRLTDENRPAMFELAMSMYLDDVCMYCHRNFTRQELGESVWAHPNKFGRIVHGECWKANN